MVGRGAHQVRRRGQERGGASVWSVTLRQLMAQLGGVTTDHGGEAP